MTTKSPCIDLRPPLYPGYPYPSLGSMEQLAAWHRNPYSIPLSSASPGSPMARCRDYTITQL